MTKERLLQSIKLHWLKGQKRNYYMKKVFGGFGENISYFPTIMPLYPELIKFHNNIVVASGVSFCTHDAIHKVLNVCGGGKNGTFKECVGCIEIMDNVFIGTQTTILFDVRIGSNVIIGANSLVNKDLEGGYVYAGNPVRKICSFDEFVNKRINSEYSFVEASQHISKNETHVAWSDFNRNRTRREES